MKILKEIECFVNVAGEEVKCLIFVNAYYTINQKFGTKEAWLEDVEIDEILSLDCSPFGVINQSNVSNIGRLKDYLYNAISNSIASLDENDMYTDSYMEEFDDIDYRWNKE